MTICPQCNGFGFIGDIFGRIHSDCPLCNSSGKVNNRFVMWKLYGKALREYRLKWMKLTLREAARKYHIDASNLSKMERGVIKPHKYWYPWILTKKE
jgi:hypothetical protein